MTDLLTALATSHGGGHFLLLRLLLGFRRLLSPTHTRSSNAPAGRKGMESPAEFAFTIEEDHHKGIGRATRGNGSVQ